MKSAFDIYFGGSISSRQQMQQRLRHMQVDGSVMEETAKAIDSRTPVQVIEDCEKFKKDRKSVVLRKEKGGAPYVGVIFGFEAN